MSSGQVRSSVTLRGARGNMSSWWNRRCAMFCILVHTASAAHLAIATIVVTVMALFQCDHLSHSLMVESYESIYHAGAHNVVTNDRQSRE